MENFKKEFEMRRVIFGLISILRCPGEAFPQLIQQRLPDLFKTTAELCTKQYTERMKTLEENEKDIKEEQEEQAKKAANGDDDDGFEDEEDSDEDLDDDAEFEKTKKALLKFKNGGMDDDDDDDDDMDDSDYENAAGDMNLYDSKLDELDELNYMKDTMNVLQQN